MKKHGCMEPQYGILLLAGDTHICSSLPANTNEAFSTALGFIFGCLELYKLIKNKGFALLVPVPMQFL